MNKQKQRDSFFLQVGSCFTAMKEKNIARKLLIRQVHFLYPKYRKPTAEEQQAINEKLLTIRTGIEKKNESILEFSKRKNIEYKRMVRNLHEEFPEYVHIFHSMKKQDAEKRAVLSMKEAQLSQKLIKLTHELLTPFKVNSFDYCNYKDIDDPSMLHVYEDIGIPHIEDIFKYIERHDLKFSAASLKSWSLNNKEEWEALINWLYKENLKDNNFSSMEIYEHHLKHTYCCEKEKKKKKHDKFKSKMNKRIENFIKSYEEYIEY